MMILLMKKIAIKASSTTIELISIRPESSLTNLIPLLKITRKNQKNREGYQRKVQI